MVIPTPPDISFTSANWILASLLSVRQDDFLKVGMILGSETVLKLTAPFAVDCTQERNNILGIFTLKFRKLCFLYVSARVTVSISHSVYSWRGVTVHDALLSWPCPLSLLSQHCQACHWTAEAPAVWGAARIRCHSLVEGCCQGPLYQGETGEPPPPAHTSIAQIREVRESEGRTQVEEINQYFVSVGGKKM